MKTMKKDVLILIIRMLLILLFLYASFSKIFDIEGFKNSMQKQPFPHWMSNILLFLVPASEIYLSILLLREKSWKIGMVYSSILMGLFTLYIAAVLLHFFRFVPCSCGGVIKLLTWQQHLIFNLFFLSIAIIGCAIKIHPNEGASRSKRQLSI